MRKYIILPSCLLVLNVVQEVVVYKAALIRHAHLRVLFLVFMFALGFTFVGFVVYPLIERSLRNLHRSSKSVAGRIGEVLFLAMLCAGLYFLYYQIYIHGPHTLLPRPWRNPLIRL
ncbi:MAG: hypothetical protein JXR37_15680 [Kiritimatiellae bacterium]|nr:hypothetical protein [Kiritimatiellia bacterium]